MSTPGVEQCLVVTEGHITLGPDGSEADLGCGDSVHFDGSLMHRYGSAEGNSRGVLLMIYH